MDYTSTTLDEHDVSDVDVLHRIYERDSVSWVDIQGFGDLDTIAAIGRIFGLHDLILSDVANVPQRPKVQEYDDHLLIVTRMIGFDDSREVVREQVSLVLGPNYLLTFQEQYGDQLDPVRQRIRSDKGPIRKSGPDYLASAILGACVDGYFPAIDQLGTMLEELEEATLSDPTPDTLREINHVRSVLLILRRLLWPTRDATAKLAREDHALVSDAARVYFRDIHDSVQQASEHVETFRDMTSGLMNTYLSAAGNRMNEIMKLLTIMSSIFIPLTFMAGIYGMNFDTMPELRLPWAYPTLLGIMAVTGIAMLVYFRRRGWLGSRTTSG